MKKTLHLFAATAMIATMASCSNEELIAPVDGADGNVVFSVALPSQAYGSRAFADGLTAERLDYAVYDASSGYLVTTGETSFNNSLQTTVSLTLANGKSYDIAFFASNNGTEGGAYTFDATSKTVTVNYANMTAYNSTDYDAFYNLTNTGTITGPLQKKVTLTRPLAQINWGTRDLTEGAVTATDMYGEDAANLVSKVIVKGVYTGFNLLDGTMVGNETDVTFPNLARPDAKEETFPVEPNTYKYLSMNYVLVPSTQSLVEAELVPSNGTTEFTSVKVTNLPVQANYRTNIYGALLTNPADFTVIKDNEYADSDYNVEEWTGTEDELYNLIAAGGQVQIAKAIDKIDLTNYSTDKPLTLLLNAKVGEILVKDFSNTVTVSVGKDVEYPQIKGVQYPTYPMVKNFTFEGNLDSSIKCGQLNLYSWGAGLENVTIQNIRFDGSNINERNSSAIVNDRYVNNNLVIKNCVFENMKFPGIYITKGLTDQTPSGSVTVENCTVKMLDEAVSSSNGLYLLNINNVVVKGCEIENAAYHGIFVRGFQSIIMSDNTVNGAKEDGIKVETMVTDASGYTNSAPSLVEIENNSVRAKANGIRVKSNSDVAEKLVITDNKIDMTDANAFNDGEPYGILVKGKDSSVNTVLTVLGNTKVGTNDYWFYYEGFTPGEGSDYATPYAE